MTHTDWPRSLANVDDPTFKSPEWERRRAALAMEVAAQVGQPHERQPQPEPLRWTSEPPAQEGWWWNRQRDTGIAVPVFVFRQGISYYLLDPGGKHQCDVRGRWRDEWSDRPISEPVP